MHRSATAEWFDPIEFAESNPMKPGQFWLGRCPIQGTPLGFSDDRHVCMVSGTRSGKGTTTIVNNLCLWPGSVVVVDPKGENATVTAARRGPGSEYCEGMGQTVHVLDPFEESIVPDELRSRFNPLDALDPDSPHVIDDAGLLADAIVVINERSSDPYWDQSARKLVKGLILHVLTSPMFEGRRNLLTVRDLIARGDHEGVAYFKAKGRETIPSAQGLLWEGVSRNQALDGVIAGIGEQMVNVAVNAVKQFEGALQVADRNTEFLDSPKMRACLESSDFELKELKTDPKGMSLYLSLPQRYMPEHFRWLRMMITLTTTTMESHREQPACGHRVLMCLDEFAGLERIKAVENAVAQIAGYGVTMFFVLQSLEQFKKVYPDSWETFLACSATKIFFAVDDQFTRKYLSELIGETEMILEVETYSETQGSGTSEMTGTNTSETTGENISLSQGRSLSSSEGRSESQTKGKNTSHTEGTSESFGKTKSKTKGSNKGRTKSKGENEGESHNQSWNPSKFLFRNTERFIPFMRENETANFGNSSGSNTGSSKNRGQNKSKTKGTSESEGTSETDTEGTSESYTSGINSSTTRSTNESRTYGQNRSKTAGESASTTTSANQSSTSGMNQTIQKRPLVTTDEIGVFFDRAGKKVPGWAIVLIGGARPAAVQRTPYFRDQEFAWLFDPHPDHARPPKLLRDMAIPLPEITHDLSSKSLIEWRAGIGDRVERGDVILEVSTPLPRTLMSIEHLNHHDRDVMEAFPECSINDDRIQFPVYSPASGSIKGILAEEGEQLNGFQVAGHLEVSNRQLLLEAGPSDRESPIGGYPEYLAGLRAEEARLRQEAEDERLAAQQEAEDARLAAQRAAADKLAQEERKARLAEENRIQRELLERNRADYQRATEVARKKVLDHSDSVLHEQLFAVIWGPIASAIFIMILAGLSPEGQKGDLGVIAIPLFIILCVLAWVFHSSVMNAWLGFFCHQHWEFMRSKSQHEVVDSYRDDEFRGTPKPW